MPKAVVDPEDLRGFAAQLRKFTDDVQGSLAHLEAGFRRLGETWRDQEHERFAQVFTDTTKTLHRFLGASEPHITHLLLKAEQIDKYFQR